MKYLLAIILAIIFFNTQIFFLQIILLLSLVLILPYSYFFVLPVALVYDFVFSPKHNFKYSLITLGIVVLVYFIKSFIRKS